jgi:DNA-binding MurR/RpiR family transcriptional regulator
MEHKSIKQIIKAEYDGLSDSNKKIAKFVIDNYDQSMLMDSKELAAAAGVSNTAAIRYAKALGFSGFLEYKNTLKKEYTKSQKVYSYLSRMDSLENSGYYSRYSAGINEDINGFLMGMKSEVVDSFCHRLLEADTVYIMGIGSDEVIVAFLYNYLNVMGIKCIRVIEEGLTLQERLFQISEKDVLILSGFPTLTEDEKWAARYVKKKQAGFLLLTDSELTAAGLDPDHYICMRESQDTFFNSYILPMVFCNALLLRLYELAPERTSGSMKAYQDMLDEV